MTGKIERFKAEVKNKWRRQPFMEMITIWVLPNTQKKQWISWRLGPYGPFLRYSWNPKQPFFIGCFNWMIQNLYLGNGRFTKHPFKTGCLEFQGDDDFPTLCTRVSFQPDTMKNHPSGHHRYVDHKHPWTSRPPTWRLAPVRHMNSWETPRWGWGVPGEP